MGKTGLLITKTYKPAINLCIYPSHTEALRVPLTQIIDTILNCQPKCIKSLTPLLLKKSQKQPRFIHAYVLRLYLRATRLYSHLCGYLRGRNR